MSETVEFGRNYTMINEFALDMWTQAKLSKMSLSNNQRVPMADSWIKY